MSLIVCGCVAPLVLALLVWVRIGSGIGSAARHDRATPGPGARDVGLLPARAVSRWEGLSEEIARRGTRRRPVRSTEATRRRHLAAVLPADARR